MSRFSLSRVADGKISCIGINTHFLVFMIFFNNVTLSKV